eukprot:gnl/TRDRNA2_/TRDRNA2_94373_c0_seq1.p2 gnl/TRDRNA2_/TRDRNA2_94373_c0~~gnl/TRDRNA2_/TRDRNA2_94373_c0_seq1.p2  ORF type:complete len:146 (+),score=26.31 gnl/TRDRNA2_/TRDRNA2_94373_c0_seq1:35-472(+)
MLRGTALQKQPSSPNEENAGAPSFRKLLDDLERTHEQQVAVLREEIASLRNVPKTAPPPATTLQTAKELQQAEKEWPSEKSGDSMILTRSCEFSLFPVWQNRMETEGLITKFSMLYDQNVASKSFIRASQRDTLKKSSGCIHHPR